MSKLKVGVIGLGMMGLTHLDVYGKRDDVEIIAIADKDADRLSGQAQAAGNIEGQAEGGVDLSGVKRYEEGTDLINDPDVEIVDVCLPTPLHLEFGKAVLAAGKHLLMEKPLARTHAQAVELLEAAKASPNSIAMPGMCMRFWPGWDWLKEAVDNKTYGKVLGATFRRVASHPGGLYLNGESSGGAALDLHIHDTDFIQHLFGTPKAVRSTGYQKLTGKIDHMTTQYVYDDIPMVVAEGGWVMTDGFPFTMQYTVNFENATAVFDLAAEHTLTLIEKDKEPQPVELAPEMGYDFELHYFLDCIKNGQAPTTVTFADAAEAVRIVEAEVASIESGDQVAL